FSNKHTTEIYTLSLHDALPIYRGLLVHRQHHSIVRRHHVEADNVSRLGDKRRVVALAPGLAAGQIDLLRPQEPPDILLVNVAELDRKSTRLNSSHVAISYAVFC